MVVAPGRARRPGASDRPAVEPPSPQELDTCPFCEGREDRTPPETLALGRDGGSPDTPGWGVRVVPNLFPAFERQEVVVHTPRHTRSLAELTAEELALITEAWSRRASEREGFEYIHAVVNEGREAGATLPHSHSQLVWFPDAPPAVQDEWSDECGVCDALARDELVIARQRGVVLASRWASRAPYELLVMPEEHGAIDAFQSTLLPTALQLAAEGIRRLHRVEGDVPLNLWLHDHAHWHIEVLPRLTVFAGIELGAGIYVNTLAPEEAAERLRGAAI